MQNKGSCSELPCAVNDDQSILCYLWFLYFMIMGLNQHNPALNPVSQTEMFGGNGCGSKQRFRGVVHFPLPQNNKTKNLKCNMLHCACNLVKSYASCYTDGSRLLKPAWDHMLQHNLLPTIFILFLASPHLAFKQMAELIEKAANMQIPQNVAVFL